MKTRGIVIYYFLPEKKCLEMKVVNKKALSIPKPKVAGPNQSKNLRIKQEEIVKVQIIIEVWFR